MYIFVIYLLLLLMFILNAYKEKKFNIPIILVIFLIAITGFRKSGYDLGNYFINFQEMNQLKDVITTLFEPGYAFCALIFKKVFTIFLTDSNAFTVFMLFIASVSIFLKYKTINHFSKLPIFAFAFYFLCFFIYNDFTQIRHGIAIAFCFYSLTFVDKKKPWPYFACVVTACLFHYSAIFFLPVYFLRNIEMDKKKLAIIIITSLLISFLDIKEIMLFINNHLIHSSYIANKLNLYEADSLSLLNYSSLFKMIFIGMYFYFAYDKKDGKDRICVNTYIFGIFLFNVLSSYSIIAYRVNAFFRMTEIILLSNYINKLPDMKYKKLNLIFIVGVICYYIYKFILVIIDPNYLIYFV